MVVLARHGGLLVRHGGLLVRHGGLATISCACANEMRFPPSGNDKHAHGQCAGAGFSRCGVGARVPWEPRQT